MAMSSTRSTLTLPLLAASVRFLPQKPLSSMMILRPALADATPECCASQSLTMNPSMPSSVFRMPFSSFEFWHLYELFACWYEHITLPTPSLKESMNGKAYSSCRVRLLTFELSDSPKLPGFHRHSCSFKSQCFAEAITPVS